MLLTHEAVHDAAVTVRDSVGGHKQLLGFAVPNEGMTVSPSDLFKYLKERMPAYMVPALLVLIPELPLNLNGKLDNAALLRMASQEESTLGGGEEDEAVVTSSLEKELLEIWSAVLKRKVVASPRPPPPPRELNHPFHTHVFVQRTGSRRFLRPPGGGGGHSEAGYGRPVDRGAWTAKTVKRPQQPPAHPQYANYWAPLTRKRHTIPHSAQSQHTNYWAPRTRKRHQQEHRPQLPTQSSDPTQHAKGRTGDCPGTCKATTTRRNVTQGAPF